MSKVTYINSQNDTNVELNIMDLEAFYSKPVKTYLPAGHHVVKLAHYEVVPEKTVTTRTDRYTTKPYILLDLVDVKTHEATETRLYSGFVPYFMEQLVVQTKGEISGMTLKQLFDYLGKNSFDIWVKYDPQNGVQVSYQRPKSN